MGVLRSAATASVIARRIWGFWYVVGVTRERVFDGGNQLSMFTRSCRGTTNDTCRFLSFQIKVLLEVVDPALGFVGGGYAREPHG